VYADECITNSYIEVYLMYGVYFIYIHMGYIYRGMYHIYIHIYVCVYIYYIYIHIYVCMYICSVYVHIYVCKYVTAPITNIFHKCNSSHVTHIMLVRRRVHHELLLHHPFGRVITRMPIHLCIQRKKERERETYTHSACL